ncbi:MAG: Cys-tRNA(Pro) deacylase [Clostridia bacterium]|nr:Cys-tRNA(Pro) deacylase [Clostridia bacterium]
MSKPEEKTNAIRILDLKKISYSVHDYQNDAALPGEEIAKAMGKEPEEVFKTLVTVGKSGGYYVFDIPVNRELDLKKAASAVGEKSVEMVKHADLFRITGYIHGGCSPIGMKKTFPTVFDVSVRDRKSVCFSAGRIGKQIEMSPADIGRAIKVSYADLVRQTQ